MLLLLLARGGRSRHCLLQLALQLRLEPPELGLQGLLRALQQQGTQGRRQPRRRRLCLLHLSHKRLPEVFLVSLQLRRLCSPLLHQCQCGRGCLARLLRTLLRLLGLLPRTRPRLRLRARGPRLLRRWRRRSLLLLRLRLLLRLLLARWPGLRRRLLCQVICIYALLPRHLQQVGVLDLQAGAWRTASGLGRRSPLLTAQHSTARCAQHAGRQPWRCRLAP